MYKVALSEPKAQNKHERAQMQVDSPKNKRESMFKAK
jgi:hypothetical protein